MASRRNSNNRNNNNKNNDHGYYGNNNNKNFVSRLNLNNDDGAGLASVTPSSLSSQNYNYSKKNKKFIGGAERARQDARKRQWEPKNNTHHRNSKKQHKSSSNLIHDNNNDDNSRVMNSILSNRKLRPSERFYAALLQPTNYYHNSSASNKTNRNIILQRICLGLGLGLPPNEYNTPAVIPHTDNIRTFFTSRAILVMDESR